MLVPGILVPYLATLGRGLGRAGIRLPLDNTVAVDLHTGQVAPVRPALGLEDAFEALAQEYSGGEVMNRFEFRQPVDVDVVCSVGLSDELVGPVSRATATYRLASHAQNLKRLGVAGVLAVQRAGAGARTVEIQSRTVRQTADALRAAAAL
jgi:hypothetical protein